MRHLRHLLAVLTLCLLLGGCLSLTARADSAASSVDIICTVNADGDCFVSMSTRLRIEAARDKLVFPLPLEARNVTMNGSGNISTTRSTSSLDVDISRNVRDYIGGLDLRFEFTLPKVVKVIREDNLLGKKGELQMEIPMLSGFELPIEQLSFTVTMPGSGTFSPRWYSIYRQESIASDLKVISSGSQIIGSSTTTLNDHESMTMSMAVPKTMFPSVSTYIREGNPEIMQMLICVGAAMLYWLLFLFNKPMRPARTSTPPEGITAGEMGCRLTLAGADLTTMVFSWAQLGYILMYADENGRVLINKRMDMGNERSAFENKVFRMLFGNRRTVDATGNQYAVLCGKVADMIPNEKQAYKGNSGNMKVFRWLCCAMQVFCGICVAMNMASIRALQIILAIILGALGAVTAWMIQGIAYRTHLRGKIPVYIGLGCIVLWILLGVLCGQVWVPLCASLGQWALGYFAAYGGRRSDLGRHESGLVLGFRHYAKRLPREDVGRLLSNDPDYFFNLAPYALALGVIKPFGDAFGRRKMDQCPYLLTPVHGKRTSDEWAKLIADTADKMDAKARRMQLERLMPVQLPRITIQLNPPARDRD